MVDDPTFQQTGGSLYPLVSLHFALDKDEIHHERKIYGPLDFLGDVGGLADALNAIGLVTLKVIYILSGGSGLS